MPLFFFILFFFSKINLSFFLNILTEILGVWINILSKITLNKNKIVIQSSEWTTLFQRFSNLEAVPHDNSRGVRLILYSICVYVYTTMLFSLLQGASFSVIYQPQGLLFNFNVIPRFVCQIYIYEEQKRNNERKKKEKNIFYIYAYVLSNCVMLLFLLAFKPHTPYCATNQSFFVPLSKRNQYLIYFLLF